MPDDPAGEDRIDAALRRLTEPERFRRAEARVAQKAPELQHVLIEVLGEGGYFDAAHESLVRQAIGNADEGERLRAVRTLLAEETRMGMLIGVAVGWELALELETNDDDHDDEGDD